MRSTGQRLSDRKHVDHDEDDRHHVEDPGQTAEVAARADDKESHQAYEDRRGKKEREVINSACPDGHLAGNVAEREKPEEEQRDEEACFRRIPEDSSEDKKEESGTSEGYYEGPDEVR